MELLLLSISLLRLLLPSLALSLLLLQGLAQAILRLAARLQASSFLETAADYRRIPSSNLMNSRISVILPPDQNGILPVVVPIRNYRRWLIYSLISVITLAYLSDAAIFIAHSIVSNSWQSTADPFWKYQEFYTIGAAVALAGQALIMAWQERKRGLGGFKSTFPVAMFIVLLAGEIALVAVMARKLQLDSKRLNTWHDHSETVVTRLDGWTIAHLVMQSARILMLLLGLLAFTPMFKRTEYMPNEYRSMLAAQENGGASSPQNSNASYGTFNGNGAGHSKHPSLKGQASKDPSAGEQKHSFWQRIKILSPYLWPRKSRTLQAVALVCFLLLGVGRVVNLFVPRTLGKLVEELSVREAPWKHLLLYCGLRFLQGNGGVIQVISSNLWAPVAQYSEREMSQMTFSHLLNLSLSFQVKKKTGEVLRTLDRGSAINSFFQVLLFQLVPIAVDILIAIVYLWATFGLLLATLVTIIMTTYVITSVVLTRLRVKYRRDMNEKDKYTRGILADALANWETIKYFTAEEREQTRYVNAIKDYQRAEYKVIASLNFLNLMQNAIISLGLVTGSLIVAFSVVQGTRTVGQFVMFLTYLTQLYGPLNSLGMLYRMIQTNLTDTDNLMKLLAEETEIMDKPDAEELVNAKGEIELNHVNFSYDGRVTALKDISVKIAPGTSVALVGESGAGKSTLLRLLYRFYEITGGSIKFDGKDIRDVTQTSLRRAIGVVPQEAVLFNESIAYNIGYGKDNATQQDIEEAAKAAHIYSRIVAFPDGMPDLLQGGAYVLRFIEPPGWNTKVGERGVRLSGGEKQRVSIARAILKNPAILLLDEATSALDTGTEREIQQSLRHLAEGRTSIAIAHRLSTITYCDLILVLNDGEIAEQGDHKTLLAQKGLYYNLWNKQIRAEEEAVEEVKEVIAERREIEVEAGSTAHPHHS